MDTGSGCGSLVASVLALLGAIFGALFFGVATTSSPISTPPSVLATPSVELVLTSASNRELTADALQATVDIYRERLAALGITTAEIDLLDQAQIRVRLAPGSQNLEETIYPALMDIGFLEFVDFAGLTDEQVTSLKSGAVQTTGQIEVFGAVIDPNGAVHPGKGTPFTTIATAADVATATPFVGPDGNSYVIELVQTDAGAEKLRAYTAANVGQVLAIVRDGKVIMAPRVMSEIGSKVHISGSFTREAAFAFAAQLGSRPLPSRMQVASINIIQ